MGSTVGQMFGKVFGLSGSASFARRLVVATMLLALFAAAAPAFGPSVSAQGEVPAAGTVAVQALSCPFEYAGDDYLNDCTETGLLSVSLTDPAGTTVSEETDAQGDISFAGGAVGQYSLEYGFPREARAEFYYACFDGADVFLFDGTANVIDFSLAGGDSLFCRVYVTLVPIGDPDPAPSVDPNAPATGEFRVNTCPADYAGEDFLSDCPAGPAGDTFRVFADGGNYDVSVETDANGVAAFSELPTGEISVSLDIATVDGDAGFDFFCYTDQPGDASFLGQGNTGNVDLDIDAGIFYFCEFYVTPLSSSASAAFQVFECPVEYAGDDYLTDCAPVDPAAPVDVLLSPGAEFDVENAFSGRTGAEGRVLFEPLDAGTYSAALDVSERVNSFYYACFDVTSGSEVFLFAGESVQLTAAIAEGGLLSCRWYIIPTDLGTGGNIDLNFQVFACPEVYEGAADYTDDCEPVTESNPIDVLLNAGPDLDPATADVQTTDAEGRVSFLNLQGGQYIAGLDIAESDRLTQYFCYDTITGELEPLVNGEGNVIPLQLGDDLQIIRCDWFVSFPETEPSTSAAPSASAPSASPSAAASVTPSARPSASAGPIGTLPSTGTGVNGDSGAFSLALAALVAVALAAATVIVARRPAASR